MGLTLKIAGTIVLLNFKNLISLEVMTSHQLDRNIINFYRAERKEAVFMLFWGFLATGVVIWVLFWVEEIFWRGMAFSALPLSSIQLLTGVRNLIFVNRKRSDILTNMGEDVKKAIEAEKLRILNSQIRLRVYRIIEQVLFCLGFLFMLLGGIVGLSVFLAGSGIGIMLQAAILLVQDLFAEWRTGLYLEELEVESKR
ncbi:MAG: hypothetical protein AAGG68_16410 [Bacteroidota bacterium]